MTTPIYFVIAEDFASSVSNSFDLAKLKAASLAKANPGTRFFVAAGVTSCFLPSHAVACEPIEVESARF